MIDISHLKATVLQATDDLAKTKRDYYQQKATYEDVRNAAIRVLEARIAIEKAKTGRAKTKITPISVANLCR